jgi:hypothetical protein
MHNVVDYQAVRKRRKKGEFEMAREAVITRIASHPGLSPLARLLGVLLFMLASNRKHYLANGQIDAFGFSVEEMAKRIGRCERTVQRLLRDLEKAGLLVTVLLGSNYAKRTSRYRATVPPENVTLPMKKDNILLFSQSDTSRQSQARVAKGGSS